MRNRIKEPHQHVAVHTVCTLRKSRLCCNVLLHFPPPLTQRDQAGFIFCVCAGGDGGSEAGYAIATKECDRYDGWMEGVMTLCVTASFPQKHKFTSDEITEMIGETSESLFLA